MRDLSDILTWKQSFGLLPIHLKPKSNESNFVMLNGGYGDFCLQTLKDKSNIDDYYSQSWSSNTKNFVVLEGSKVKIFNWLKNKPEEISKKQVLDNFDKFYNYLLSQSNKSERDVVPFIIDLFRQFRNITLEKTNPLEALNLLFVLLTSLEEDSSNLDRKKWNLNEFIIPKEFDSLTEKLNKGINNIKPQLDLIIRHSAGILFQEAQKEVLFFNRQMDLFDGVPSTIKTKTNSYSSIHYTPPYIARTIVENTIRQLDLSNKKKLKIFDPACGSSEFLIEALKQLKELNYKGSIEVKGWDSSETAVNTSNFLLQYEKRTIWDKKLSFEIKLVTDSLTETWDQDYDIILMNPPFVSWELLTDKNSKDAVRDTLGSNFNGRPNQAAAFFYKSIQCLNNDGVIGCVIPSSLLTLDSYKALRSESYDLISINLIGKLGNFIFEDALTDISLIIAHKPKSVHIPIVLWTKNEKGIAQNALRDLRKMYYSNELTVNEKDYGIFQPITFPIIDESWKVISIKENEFFKTFERFVKDQKLVRIEDIFNVQQGIRTGNNSIFKISKKEFLELPQHERIFFRPVADNESIKNGSLNTNNYVWYPYDEEGLILKTENELEKEAPFFYNKIVQHKVYLSTRARKSDSDWWQLSEHRAWLRKNCPRLISSEFGKSDSFAFDKSGHFAVERGNAWLPLSKYEKDFQNTDFYYFYLAIFSSTFFDKLLSIYSKQLAGGNWYDLGKKYTSKIPIPKIQKGSKLTLSSDINKIHIESPIFKQLVEYGTQISLGILFDKTGLDNLIQKYVYPIKY